MEGTKDPSRQGATSRKLGIQGNRGLKSEVAHRRPGKETIGDIETAESREREHGSKNQCMD